MQYYSYSRKQLLGPLQKCLEIEPYRQNLTIQYFVQDLVLYSQIFLTDLNMQAPYLRTFKFSKKKRPAVVQYEYSKKK